MTSTLDAAQDLTPGARPIWASMPEDSLVFVGNATVILRVGGITILTDPNFLHRGERVGLGYGLTSVRVREPALGIDELPPIDLVLLSHLHEDHFDRVAQERLARDVPILTTPQAARELGRRGFAAATGLDPWDSRAVAGSDERVRITALPGRHGPGVLAALLPDVMGSLIELTDARGPTEVRRRIYITGDTLVFEGIDEIGRRVPSIDLALLHLGGTRVMGITLTMDGAAGVRLLQKVPASRVIPIHVDDYEVFTSPLTDFLSAAEQAGVGGRVRVVERGEIMPLFPEA